MKSLRSAMFLVLASMVLVSLAAAEEGLLATEPPKEITAQEIIKKFTAKEKEFKSVRKRCTYRQVIKIQQLDGDKPVGEYQQVADVTLDQSGKKVKNVVFAPQPSISISPEDQYDIESRLHFTLSTDELPEYNVVYQGKQQEDDLHTYVFDVAPKQLEKGKRYFEGRIWVDDHDFQIVRMAGKSVPDIHPKKRGKGNENLFPKFTTYREQVDGKYWFPTYTHADDTLSNTRSTRTSAFFRWIAWNMQYHTAHHTFPAVPFHALPELHREIPMEGLSLRERWGARYEEASAMYGRIEAECEAAGLPFRRPERVPNTRRA